MSAGSTRLGPSMPVVPGYSLSFDALTLALRSLPMGVAYAVWAGLGIVLISLDGVVIHKKSPDLVGVTGIGLIVAGVLVIKPFSSVTPG